MVHTDGVVGNEASTPTKGNMGADGRVDAAHGADGRERTVRRPRRSPRGHPAERALLPLSSERPTRATSIVASASRIAAAKAGRP
jgi:hypothetical protein